MDHFHPDGSTSYHLGSTASPSRVKLLRRFAQRRGGVAKQSLRHVSLTNPARIPPPLRSCEFRTYEAFMERTARLIKNNKLSETIFTNEDLARAIWPAAVGKAIAAHTSRLKLVRSTLVVELEDAIWQRQLYPLTRQILNRISQVTGSDIVQDIEFRIAVPRRQPGRAELPEVPAPAVLDEAESIQDPVLKKVYRLSRKKATA